MYDHSLYFGLTSTGRPYVQARNGRVEFASVDDAATFVERRARTLLEAYSAVQTAVDEDIAALGLEVELVPSGNDDDIPF